MLNFKRIKCSGCGSIRYVPKGHADYVCQCQKANGERKTDDRQRIKYDDPQWNYLGINSDFNPKSDKDKKDQAFEQNTPLNTYNEV